MRHILTFTLAIAVGLPGSTLSATAQTLAEMRTQRKENQPPKIAPDLAALLAQDDDEKRQAIQGLTLAQIRQTRTNNPQKRASKAVTDSTSRTKINGALLPSSDTLPEENQSFIVQVDNTTPAVVWQEKLALVGGRIRQKMNDSGLVVVEAPRTAIRQIAAEKTISYISPDRPLQASGHLETTTGAAQIRSLVKNTKLDGAGIGIAIIDSGVAADHHMLNPTLNYSYYTINPDGSYTYAYQYGTAGATVVAAQKSFLSSDVSTDDAFGHGSHVAAMVSGNANFQKAFYTGIAPGAKLLNLRVLDSQGAGTASSVIAALDWCVANKTTYNIRVINLSLGTIAKDSYLKDPICLAARRAVNAGIVVVAAAGNDGKDANGNKIYGGIHSPGIDPSVITVGASNTYGTDTRSDDTITTYSSRGPTRGYTTDAAGVRHYDNLIKPDLVAPGNRIIAAQSFNRIDTTSNNSLVQSYPALNIFNNLNDVSSYQDGNSGGGSGLMAMARTTSIPLVGTMQLSGTSMSAPVVSGAVALMLQTNPNLTPSLVKAILTYTAQPLKGFNMLEQGAGELNIDGAVRLAKLVKTTLPTTSGAALLSASLPAQQSTIAGVTIKWGQGVSTNYGFLYGSILMTAWQPVYASGQILSDATGIVNGRFSLLPGKTTSSAGLKSGALQINGSGVILGDSVNTVFVDGIVLGDGVIIGDGIVLGDGVILGDGIVLGDGTTRADTTLRPSSFTAVLGDDTTAMKPVS